MEEVGGGELRAGIKNNTRTNGCELVIKKSEPPDWKALKEGNPMIKLRLVLIT